MPATLPAPSLIGIDPLAGMTAGLSSLLTSGSVPVTGSALPRATFHPPTRSFLFALLAAGGSSVIATPVAGAAWIAPDEIVPFEIDCATGQQFGVGEVLTGFSVLPNSVANPTCFLVSTAAPVAGIIQSSALTSPIAGLALVSGGTGYPNAGTISFTGGGGVDGAGTYTAAAGVLQTVTLTNPGRSYATVPTPVFSGGGSGAVLTVTLQLRRVTVWLANCVGGQSYIIRCACQTSYGRVVEVETAAIPCAALP